MAERLSRPNWVRAPLPVSPGLRIGLLGGSFNPAHEGHLHISALALTMLRLDFVWWLVSPQNPLKPETGMMDFKKRVASAGKFGRHPKIAVTDIEWQLGTRFTIDTVKKLQRRFPTVRFVWLMGSDNLIQLPRWRRWQQIVRALPIAVATRPGTAFEARISKAAIAFRTFQAPADWRLPQADPPAWAILDLGRRSFVSATAIRAASRR